MNKAQELLAEMSEGSDLDKLVIMADKKGLDEKEAKKWIMDQAKKKGLKVKETEVEQAMFDFHN